MCSFRFLKVFCLFLQLLYILACSAVPVLANENEKVLFQRRKRSILDVAFDHCSSEECVRPKPGNLAVKGSSSLKVIIS